MLQVLRLVSRIRICEINQFSTTFTCYLNITEREIKSSWGKGRRVSCRKAIFWLQDPFFTLFFHVVQESAFLITTFILPRQESCRFSFTSQGTGYRIKLNLGREVIYKNDHLLTELEFLV